jgi:hypothetical protein
MKNLGYLYDFWGPYRRVHFVSILQYTGNPMAQDDIYSGSILGLKNGIDLSLIGRDRC